MAPVLRETDVFVDVTNAARGTREPESGADGVNCVVGTTGLSVEALRESE